MTWRVEIIRRIPRRNRGTRRQIPARAQTAGENITNAARPSDRHPRRAPVLMRALSTILANKVRYRCAATVSRMSAYGVYIPSGVNP